MRRHGGRTSVVSSKPVVPRSAIFLASTRLPIRWGVGEIQSASSYWQQVAGPAVASRGQLSPPFPPPAQLQSQ